MSHPSTMALDRHHLARRPDGDVAAHVAGCLRCSDYLRALSVRPALPPSMRVRASLPAPRRSWLALRVRWVEALALASVCAIVAVVGLSGPDAPQTRAKGGPGAAVLVKRGEAPAFVWLGEGALRPGDRIRLRLSRGAFSRAEVVAGGKTLWEGALTEPETLTPVAWELADAGVETVRVVFHAGGLGGIGWSRIPAGDELAVELRLPVEAGAP